MIEDDLEIKGNLSVTQSIYAYVSGRTPRIGRQKVGCKRKLTAPKVRSEIIREHFRAELG